MFFWQLQKREEAVFHAGNFIICKSTDEHAITTKYALIKIFNLEVS